MFHFLLFLKVFLPCLTKYYKISSTKTIGDLEFHKKKMNLIFPFKVPWFNKGSFNYRVYTNEGSAQFIRSIGIKVKQYDEPRK